MKFKMRRINKRVSLLTHSLAYFSQQNFYQESNLPLELFVFILSFFFFDQNFKLLYIVLLIPFSLMIQRDTN